MKASIKFFVNGVKVTEKSPNPRQTLLQYLRQRLGLCGTKMGCNEGSCGSCTVMLSKLIDRQEQRVHHMAVNSCIMPICYLDGFAVTTVEGISNSKGDLHPVQKAMAKTRASNCGFCTPGYVMSMYTLLRNCDSIKPTLANIEEAVQSNLCRCTGYRPILEAFKPFTLSISGIDDIDQIKVVEPEFPQELIDYTNWKSWKQNAKFEMDNITWYQPSTLSELLTLKDEYPDGHITCGYTDQHFSRKIKTNQQTIIIDPYLVPEVTAIDIDPTGVKFGSGVTLSTIEDTLIQLIDELEEDKTRIYRAVVHMIKKIGGKQLRNVASIGGNIVAGSSSSDLAPILLAAGVQYEVASVQKGIDICDLDASFFVSHRKTIIQDDEVLLSLKIPTTFSCQYAFNYKQSKRKSADTPTINMAINVFFEPDSDIVQDMRLVYNCMGPKIISATNVCNEIIGERWCSKLLEMVVQGLIDEFILSPDAPGGAVLYRQTMVPSLFFKAYLDISQELEKAQPNRLKIPNRERIDNTIIKKYPQDYELINLDIPAASNVAYKYATGECTFIDDLKFKDELHLAFVHSEKANAKINFIEKSTALDEPGVIAFFSSEDLPKNRRKMEPFGTGNEIFAADRVVYYGQIIGAIVAKSKFIAQKAVKLIKVTYEDLSPVIVSIEDAIEYMSFFPGYPKTISMGNVTNAMNDASVYVNGEIRIGAQSPFYLETHTAIAVPRDSDGLDIYSSSLPEELQLRIAAITGLPPSNILVQTLNRGEKFGGKEFRAGLISVPVAFAAHRLNRPVRCTLDRTEDMSIVGSRHPFLIKYSACADRKGRITGCDVHIYANGGCSVDRSAEVLRDAMLHFNNSYRVPNIKCQSWLCKTNLTPCATYGDFGAPQAMMVGEQIIRQIAAKLKVHYIDVAWVNLYEPNEVTFYNQILEGCTLRRCWLDCMDSSQFCERLSQVQKFNESNRWKKRGISIAPITRGIVQSASSLKGVNAIMNVGSDGFVDITLDTVMDAIPAKSIIRAASQILDIPLISINITGTFIEMDDSKSQNIQLDPSVLAVIEASKLMKQRLAPYKKQFPFQSWNTLISKVAEENGTITTTGYQAIFDNTYDLDRNRGVPYKDMIYGATCSEVEIDCLTGEHRVLRCDVVLDIGSGKKPMFDIASIEGEFLHGYGMYAMEELLFSRGGQLLSNSATSYKMPGFSDLPTEFNVTLLKDIRTGSAVKGPIPMFISASIFFAIKEAISAARMEEGFDSEFVLVAPATPERVRLACQNKFMNQHVPDLFLTLKPLYVSP